MAVYNDYHGSVVPPDILLLLSFPLLLLKEQIGLKSAIWYPWNTQKWFPLAWEVEGLLHLVAELNRPLSVKNICKPLSCPLSCQLCKWTVLLFCVCMCVRMWSELVFLCLSDVCWVGQEVLLYLVSPFYAAVQAWCECQLGFWCWWGGGARLSAVMLCEVTCLFRKRWWLFWQCTAPCFYLLCSNGKSNLLIVMLQWQLSGAFCWILWRLRDFPV